MKKFALALVTSAATGSMAHANITTGYFAGVQVGCGLTTGKYTTTNATGNSFSGSTDVGAKAKNIGLIGGYGWVCKHLYMGAEAAYTFENSPIRHTLGNSDTRGGAHLKRTGYFNVAVRTGYVVTPQTLFYIRMGVNWSKWNFRDAGAPGPNGFTQSTTGRGSKARLTLVPGVGLETAVHKHVYARLEYSYEFGPQVRATNNSVQAFSTIGAIRNQSVKLGVAYKF